jgi:hypothetical protein
MTLDSACVDLGPSEFSVGLFFVALSRVRSPRDLLLTPFSLERLQRIGAGVALLRFAKEEYRLQELVIATRERYQHLLGGNHEEASAALLAALFVAGASLAALDAEQRRQRQADGASRGRRRPRSSDSAAIAGCGRATSSSSARGASAGSCSWAGCHHFSRSW